jgi:hypothetical protein
MERLFAEIERSKMMASTWSGIDKFISVESGESQHRGFTSLGFEKW